MKSISLRIAAASGMLAAMMGACGGSDTGRSLSEIPDPTAGDSLLYYYGQMHASHFWQDTTDSIALSNQGRHNYLRGLKDGLESLGKDENYNAGLLAGLEMARNLQQLQQDYGVKANPEIVMESIRYGLSQDSIAKEDMNSMLFYEILTRLGNQKDATDRSASEIALADKADAEGMTKVSPLLYMKVINPGYGKKVENGDKIKVEVKVTCKGRDIPIPLPKEMTAGSPYANPVVDEALRTMSEGETATFLTTAMALFGRKCTRMRLMPSDIITINILTGALRPQVLGPEKNTDGSQDTPSVL